MISICETFVRRDQNFDFRSFKHPVESLLQIWPNSGHGAFNRRNPQLYGLNM